MTTLFVPSPALLQEFVPLAPVPGRPDLLAHQAKDVFALWQAWERETGEKQDVPFWAAVWPAAQLLACFISEAPCRVAGRTVLDLGCGSGVAGIAAAKAGADRVLASDTDPVALAMAALNAAANGLELVLEGENLLREDCPEDVQVILAGDLFYERAASLKLLDWLQRARQRGVEVLIADASRPFAPKSGVRVISEATYATDPDLEGVKQRLVRLLSLEASLEPVPG